jgi:hypothetical protein
LILKQKNYSKMLIFTTNMHLKPKLTVKTMEKSFKHVVDNVVVVCIHPCVNSNNPPEILINIIDDHLVVFII